MLKIKLTALLCLLISTSVSGNSKINLDPKVAEALSLPEASAVDKVVDIYNLPAVLQASPSTAVEGTPPASIKPSVETPKPVPAASKTIAVTEAEAVPADLVVKETPSAVASPILGMPTGSIGGTYYPLAKDIAKLTARKGLNISVKTSLGSLENIRRMSSTENAGISVVQADVIEFLANTPSSINKSFTQNLKLVFPLYNEEVHLLARGEINSLADLANKRVVVGKLGSGTFVTANNILNKVGVKVVPVHDLSPKEAYQSLLLDKVDAVFFVGGKPVSYINGLLEMKMDEKLSKYASEVHLVPLEDPRLDGSYAKAAITSSDYISSDGTHRLTNEDVPTVAVQAVLVSHDFSTKDNDYYKMRCRQINELNNVVRNNIDLLAPGGEDGDEFHPKWAQVDLDQEVDLPKSACIKGVARKIDEAKEINCYLLTGKSCQ